jgi:hypothetical protein
VGVLPLIALFVLRLAPGFAFQAAAVATPGLIAELGLDHAQAGLVLGAFTLPGIVATVPPACSRAGSATARCWPAGSA